MSAVVTPTRPKASKAPAPPPPEKGAAEPDAPDVGIPASELGKDTFASIAWYRASEAEAVIRACAENYDSRDCVWGVSTILGACTDLLSRINEAPTCSGLQNASNYLAQAIDVASLLCSEVNGLPGEQLLDAGLSLMVLAKDILDAGHGAQGHD
ncbi:hypothetical protein [Simplicispira piscis]